MLSLANSSESAEEGLICDLAPNTRQLLGKISRLAAAELS